MTQTIENFKTQLVYEVSQIQDPSLLYKTYYTITTPKLESSIRDLFESRNLSTDSSDFSFFMNELVPMNQYSLEDNKNLLKKMTNGDLLDKSYLASDGKVKNLRDLVDPQIQSPFLDKLIGHKATSLSSSSVGKGEFALVLLTEGATKAKRGGDLVVDGKNVEIKGDGAKLASQSSHISMMAIRHEVEAKYPGMEIRNLTPTNLKNHYLPYFGSWEELQKFLKFVFSRVMFQMNDFRWVDECVDIDDFLIKIAIQEFTYYRSCDNIDIILFLNPNNLNFYCTSTMDLDQIQKFKISRSYRFNTERIQTTYWAVK